MQALEFLHAVQDFIGRDLSREDGDAVIDMWDDGEGRTVQDVAELLMTREDFTRVFG
jgi:hypothetical protein